MQRQMMQLFYMQNGYCQYYNPGVAYNPVISVKQEENAEMSSGSSSSSSNSSGNSS